MPENDKVALALPNLSSLGTIKDDIAAALDAATRIADFADKYAGDIPFVSSLAGPIDIIDKGLHVLDALVHQV